MTTGLIDTSYLAGVIEADVALRPIRYARALPESLDGAIPVLERACQMWGGGVSPLIPLTDPLGAGALQFYPPYADFLLHSEVDELLTTGVCDPDALHGLSAGMEATSFGWEIPAYFLSSRVDVDKRRRIRHSVVAPDDEWFIAYASALGVWPAKLDQAMMGRYGAREGLSFEDLWPVETESVTNPGLADLLARLGDYETLTPRELSTAWLRTPMVAAGGIHARDAIIPDKWARAKIHGPNIVVVYEGRSVPDLALAWNLRAAYGNERTLPIALPLSAMTQGALQSIFQAPPLRPIGLRPSQIALVSHSVDSATLNEVSRRGVRDTIYVGRPEEFIRDAGAPDRPNLHTPVWTDGRTHVPAFSTDDDSLLHAVHRLRVQPTLYLSGAPTGRSVPWIPTLRGAPATARSFLGGRSRYRVDGAKKVAAELNWPSTWTVLRALAHERGLNIRASPAGASGAALISAIGGVSAASWLLPLDLTAALARMGEATGMSWMRKRWSELAHEVSGGTSEPEETVTRLEAAAREMGVVTAGDEGRDVNFDAIKKALGGKRSSATNWVAWAESCGIVVRGAKAQCPKCGLESWRTVADAAPPINCPGCSHRISHPYGPDLLRFTYRLGEPLRRCLGEDAFWHVMACRYMWSLLGDDYLSGVHPGISFVDRETNREVAEVDVVVMAQDGSLGLGEIKRTSSGFTAHDLDTLDTIAARLGATWTFLACAEDAADIRPDFMDLRRRDGTPRYVLSLEHLLDPAPRMGLGINPFEKPSQRRDAFIDKLIDDMARASGPLDPVYGTDEDFFETNP